MWSPWDTPKDWLTQLIQLLSRLGNVITRLKWESGTDLELYFLDSDLSYCRGEGLDECIHALEPLRPNLRVLALPATSPEHLVKLTFKWDREFPPGFTFGVRNTNNFRAVRAIYDQEYEALSSSHM
jgi:hypothetical protein